MATSLFRRLRDAALFAVLIGAGATVGASAPLLAGQNESHASDTGPALERLEKNALGSIEKKGKAAKDKKAKKDKKDKSKSTASKKKSKEKKSSKKVDDWAPSPDSPGSFESQPLAGRTIDFEYDGRDAHSTTLAYSGRVFVPDRVIAEGKAVPIVVFFHGLNKALVRHRWMGGGGEGDVRRIVLEMMDAGEIPPVIIAGPGSIQPAAVTDGASFPVFDFDKFMGLTKQSLEGIAEIDTRKIIVTGHSGAGCSENGGIVSAIRSSIVPASVVSIDTCMGSGLAKTLAQAPASTNVVVTWQSGSWDREFDVFTATFKKSLVDHAPNEGVLRTLEELRTSSHDATVPMTLKKYLPTLLR